MAEKNLLYYGDNFDVLELHVKDESIDLVYLDPPFKSDRNYNVLFEEQDGTRAAAQIKAFSDTWQWDQAALAAFKRVVEEGGHVAQAMSALYDLLGATDMMAYLAMMAPRLKQLHRVLKETGALWLHCDDTASHYLKILLDAVFGPLNFRNEVIWHYGGRGAKAVARQFPSNHDSLFFYSKVAGKQKYARQYVERVMTPDEARSRGYRQNEDDGRWFKTAPRGDYTDVSIKRLESEGRIHRTRTGSVRVKYYLEEIGGRVVEDLLIGDVWNDIPDAMHIGGDYQGYETQKPPPLLERIIQACTEEGDVVLDPFCGCGTTVIAAQRVNRRWIGIDVTHLAIGLIKHWLKEAFGDEISESYQVVGEPVSLPDAERLASEDPFQFHVWALSLVGARPAEMKKGADHGIDGRLFFVDDHTGKPKQIIFSVKAGHTGVAHVRDLRGVIERERAEIGVLVSMEEPTRPMRREAASAGMYDSPGWHTSHPRLQVITIADLLDDRGIDMPPIGQVSTTYRKPRRVRERAAARSLFEQPSSDSGSDDDEEPPF